MSFLALHKAVTYLIAGLGLLALTLGGELTPAPIAFLGAAFVGSFFADGPFLAKPSYGRAWTVAVVVVLIVQVLRGLGDEAILPLGIEFAGFLQISRLFNRRTGRDHEQIVALAFLHLIAATVLSSDVEYGAIYVGFVIVTPWMLALSHLRRQIEEKESDTPDRAANVARRLASKTLVSARFLWGTALLTLPLLVGTAGLFLMFPRVGVGLLSFGQRAGEHVTGFGSDVELGQFGTIRDDPTVVMRVTPPNLSQNPPLHQEFRLRGTSFDRYDGRRWTRTQSTARTLLSYDGFFPVTRLPQPELDSPIAISLEHLDETVVFLPDNAVGLFVQSRMARGGNDRERRLSRSDGPEIRYLDGDELGLVYTAFVSTSPPRRIENLAPDERQRYLQLPQSPSMARIAALGRQVTSTARDDAERAAQIESFLRDSGQYRYSLEMPDTRDRDPLDVFLFNAKYGHCEYFATAMAVMLRTLQIPSRNVTGFLGGQLNPYGHYYAVRLGDSHSWVEAYLPGEGWRAFDPTTSARSRIGPENEGIFADARALIDAIATRWANDVVGYDLRAQMNGAFRVFDWLAGRSRSGRSIAGSLQRRDNRERKTAPWKILVGGAVAVVLLLVVASRLRRRQTTKRRVDSREARRAVRLYRALERSLARAGHARPPSVTPLEHAQALQKEGFSGAAAALAITQQYLGARYGRKPLEIERVPRKLLRK